MVQPQQDPMIDLGHRKPPGRRRALGELTNSPLILSPGGGGLSSLGLSPLQSPRLSSLTSPGEMLAPPDHISTPPKASVPGSPDTVTPTHNLKLLTELASKLPGAGCNSSARQTLQFEDFPPGIQLEGGIAPSPHRDHTYGNKVANKNVPNSTVTDIQSITRPILPVINGKTKTQSDTELFPPPAERGNRKEKSLGLLAERMLASLPHSVGGNGEPVRELQLDDTARVLQTERRRIYDIVNVLEAVQMMSKVGKNVYQWHGRTYLVQSLAWLRQLAFKLGMLEQYNVAKEQEIQMMIHNQENVNIENISPIVTPLTPTFSPMASPSPLSSPLVSPYNSPNDPNGTSMGINTQKFLMLFLVSPQPQILTLDFAARVIHGMQQTEKTRLTRIRRLYDIANILQSLGLIRKVQVTDGRGKKPAFQYVGPDVSSLILTDDEKRQMPATRQKNSLLAVGRNLAMLPDRDMSPGGNKRGRSLSEERKCLAGQQPTKLVRTKSESRLEDTERGSNSLFDLSEVCEMERQKLEVEGQEVPKAMKPPTPGRPPSRKKHLLQRYYSDSALLSSSVPRTVQVSPVVPNTEATELNRTVNQATSHISAFSRNNQRSILVPTTSNVARNITLSNPIPQSPRSSYSPVNPSPLTKSQVVQVSPLRRTPMRSPITPRDLRNSSILPPSSPTNTKLLTCSPMGPVGRSLLSSPASPRAPIDLSTRPSRHGRSPLASRALNLPPSPIPQSHDDKTHSLLESAAVNENSSPLLRAYLASNKSRIFQPILSPHDIEGVTILPGDTSEKSPSSSISHLSLVPPTKKTDNTRPTTPSPEGSSNSSATSELEGIFGTSISRPRVKPQVNIGHYNSKDTPLDFSRLLTHPQAGSAYSNGSILLNTPSPYQMYTPNLSLNTPTLRTPNPSLHTPNFNTTKPSLHTPTHKLNGKDDMYLSRY